MKTLRAMPVLQVSDMSRSVAYYEALGFNGNGWAEEGTGDVIFTIMQRGEVTLALQLLRGALRVNTHWAAYIYVDDVAALHAEFIYEGIEILELRENQHYGCSDFDVRDPDGHLIAFGQDLDPGPGPGLSDRRGKG